jgi:putative ABC transport system permease protein
MLGHYLRTLYRALARHRLYAALNVLGLALGIAVFLVLWLDVRFETSFDRWIPEAANTYRLDGAQIHPGLQTREDATTTSVIAPLLKADYPQIQAYTRIVEDDEPMIVGRTSDSEAVNYVDPDFFKVLDLPLAQGDKARALAAPGDVVISEKIARKYFGATHVVGRQFVLRWNGVPITHRVSAVLRDLPPDTHLQLDILTPLTPAFEASNTAFSRWGSVEGYTYLRFRNAADAQAVQADLSHFVDRRAKGSGDDKLGSDPAKSLVLSLVALPEVHFRDAHVSGAFNAGADVRVVVALGLVGVLTLAIAVLNYINLSTARSALRAREVAIRKVLGATRSVLVAQFLAEAVVVAFVAALIGLAITELVLPLVNAAGGMGLKLDYWSFNGGAPFLLVLSLLIGVVAGAYPAFLLSSFRPAQVLAASRMPGGGRLDRIVRGALVLLQFAAAICFIICTLVLSAQAKYLHDADRGFKRDGLILVDSLQARDLRNRQPTILDALRAVPGVTDLTVSDREPASPNTNRTNVIPPGWTGPKPHMTAETIGRNYFKTYGARVIAGRAFDAAHPLDDTAGLSDQQLSARGLNIMINQTGVKTLGFAAPADAVGKPVRVEGANATIIGVVSDVRFMSPHELVAPQFYTFNSRDFDNAFAAVRYSGIDAREMTGRLRTAWRSVVPEEPFVAKTAEARLSDYYVPDEQRARLFTMGAVLAVGIGCVGLYGLASFTAARRVKEIGIRKTLGASTTDILTLLIGQFLRPVILANLAAWPLAWLAMQNWLSGFDQRIGLGPQYFLAATAVTLLIALVTVGGQALGVARAEPAKALRHE